MITGAISAVVDATIVATNEITTRRRSAASSGARRRSAAHSVAPGASALTLLSVYGFVVTGASLRVINLHVFRTGLEQLRVGARREHLAFHQQHNLVVILDRRNLLGHRHQRDTRIV